MKFLKHNKQIFNLKYLNKVFYSDIELIFYIEGNHQDADNLDFYFSCPEKKTTHWYLNQNIFKEFCKFLKNDETLFDIDLLELGWRKNEEI